MNNKNCILTKEVIDKKLRRMALEIAEQLSEETENIILIGIKGSGMVLAQKMEQLLSPLLNKQLKVIEAAFDKKHPEDVVLSEEADFNNTNIILIDDVSNSGRALLYALKPLIHYYPKRIQTLVLVERMHKTFPIKPDYVGLSVATTLQDHIQVDVEDGEVAGAYLI